MDQARDEPEQLLSAALRAHAGGAAAPREPSRTAPPVREEGGDPRGPPALRVLLFALVLGLAAGGLAGVISVL